MPLTYTTTKTKLLESSVHNLSTTIPAMPYWEIETVLYIHYTDGASRAARMPRTYTTAKILLEFSISNLSTTIPPCLIGE